MPKPMGPAKVRAPILTQTSAWARTARFEGQNELTRKDAESGGSCQVMDDMFCVLSVSHHQAWSPQERLGEAQLDLEAREV